MQLTVKEAYELQQAVEALAGELARVQQEMQRQLSSELTTTNRRLTDLSEGLTTIDRQLTDTLQPLRATVQEHTSAFEALAVFPGRLSELEQSLLSLTDKPTHKPHLSVVTTDRPRRSESVSTPVGSDRPADGADSEATDKGAFVRRCLTDNPTMRVADIQRQAAGQGLKIAHSYISDLRKAFLAEQGKHAQQETATGTGAYPFTFIRR